MKVLIVANGSRGDVQPMLALAVGLRERGHEPLLAATPLFASEAQDFRLPFVPVGLDPRELMRQHRERLGNHFSIQAVRLLTQMVSEELRLQFEGLAPLARDFECVVAGGAVMAARTVAEAAGVPYHYIAYTPQILPSAYHGPITFPLTGTPRWLNRLMWWGSRRVYDPLILPVLNERRRALGLAPVRDSIQHIFSIEHALVTTDPELFPLPPDVSAPQTGALWLADPRPLPPEVDPFLAAGAPPVYIGFGSMPDATPERTTHLIAEAVRRVGCRALLSSGWAELGAQELGPDVLTVGPLSHWQLFPRLAGVVHHGGAGTTAAATRAGVPQVVLPHAFDQFLLANRVVRASLGVSFRRSRLSVERLARALERILQDTSIRETAARTGERIRQRDALESLIQHITSPPPAQARAAPRSSRAMA